MLSQRVLITDGHWRKSLAAVRSLGSKQGIEVCVGESTRLATAAFSRYCARTLVYPSPLSRPIEFVDNLLEELKKRKYQMLLPMEDETSDLVSQNHAEFSKLTYVPVPPRDKLSFVRRKDNVLRLADQLGIPTPKTWFPESVSELIDLKGNLSYPVVIKPRIGSGAIGVFYPNSPSELMEQYLVAHRNHPFPMIQEMIPREGYGFGASFLVDERGRVKASFVHRRLREYPVTGGASTLRESVHRNDILEMARTLITAIGWFGVAMVEFKLDIRDQTPKLMEINPRFWGSLALAIQAGVDFPYLLYRLSRGEDFEPVENYLTGRRCRWLLPGDILHFTSNPRRGKLVPEFFKFWDSNTGYDILSLSDPLPTLGRILTPLTFLYDEDMKRRLRRRKTCSTPTS